MGIPRLILANGWCAIYVPKRQLDVEKKIWGKPAQKIAKNESFLGTHMAQLTCFDGSCAIYLPHFAFDIEGATQDSERLL